MTSGRQTVPGEGLLRWPVLVALATMAVNDHLLKDVAPGVLTGKLSDVAGLVLLPVLLQAWVEVLLAAGRRFREPSDALLAACCGVSAAGFALVNVWPVAERAWQVAWGWLQLPARSLAAGRLVDVAPVVHTADVTDLLTLPVVLLPLVVASADVRAQLRHRARPARPRRAGRRLGTIAVTEDRGRQPRCRVRPPTPQHPE